MKRLIFLLLLTIPLLVDGQMIRRFPLSTNSGSGAPDYVWGALAWYEFLGDLTDSYDSNDGSVTGNISYPGDTCVYFYETDGNDYINLGDFIPTDCDSITISYLVKVPASSGSNPNYHYMGNCRPGYSGDPGFYSYLDDNTVSAFNFNSRGQNTDGSTDYAHTAVGDCLNDVTESSWHHIIEIKRRSSSTQFIFSYYIDGNYCTGADSIVSKGAWELFGQDIYFGNDWNGGTAGVQDMQFNHLMIFRGDGRFNPDGDIVQMLIADPYNMPTND